MSNYSLLAVALALTLQAGSAPAGEPDPALQLAADAKALCEQQAAQPLADCVRAALNDEDLQAVEQALHARLRAQSEAYYTEVAEKLLLREEPRAILLAARLLRTRVNHPVDDPRADAAAEALRTRIAELARAAALRAGEDAMVLWPLANGTFQREAPELTDATIARLKELQPYNLAVHFAGDTSDAWSADRLRDASKSQYFDIAYIERARVDIGLLAPFPVPEELLEAVSGEDFSGLSVHEVMVFGMLMAEAIPTMSGLMQACTANGPAWTDSHRGPCGRLATVLSSHSDSFIGVNIGLGLRSRLAISEEDRHDVEQARRAAGYRQEQFLRANMQPGGERKYAALLRAGCATEVSCMEQRIKDAGLSMEMPEGWQPMSYEELQALLAESRVQTRQ